MTGRAYIYIPGEGKNKRCERKGHRWRPPDWTAADNVYRYEICTRRGCHAVQKWRTF